MNHWEQSDSATELVIRWGTHVTTDELGIRLPVLDLRRQSRGDAFLSEMAAAWAACGVFEWIALAYLSLSSALILIFARNLAHPALLLGVQTLVAVAILVLCRLEAHVAARKGAPKGNSIASFWHFWRYWYPHLFFLFCFEELGYLVHLVYSGWHDAKLIAFDAWLTGVNPSLWLERFAHPALNEFMQFAYFTYFLYLLILGWVLYRKREEEAYWSVMTYSAVGYVLGYIVAMLFPVQSPWFTLAGMWHAPLDGGPFTALINFIEKCGRVHGAAFPSQHVAGAMAALWGAWRHRRWIFWTFLPFVVCMCLSTVYVRNHYVADVLGGFVTGTAGYFIGRWIVTKSVDPHRSQATIADPRLDRRMQTLRVCAFKGTGDLQKRNFVTDAPDQLHTDGQAIRR